MAASDLKDLKLHYFLARGSSTLARGEFIRLLLVDAGLQFEYIRPTGEEWGALKQELIKESIPNPTMPFLRANGRFIGKTVPTMRYISRKLNKYHGSNDEEEQQLDVYSDIIMDWAGKWSSALFRGDDENKKTYKTEQGPSYLKTFDEVLKKSNGPYLLGNEISYADFLLFHMVEDDRFTADDNDSEIKEADYPDLFKFLTTVKNRDNLKVYLTSDRK